MCWAEQGALSPRKAGGARCPAYVESKRYNSGIICTVIQEKWYKIGQVANGLLKDVSGNGHDGEFRQKPKWAKGVWGAGLQVGKAEGGWHAVTVPHADDMDLEEFAIGAWVKTKKLIPKCCNLLSAPIFRVYRIYWQHPIIPSGIILSASNSLQRSAMSSVTW